MSYSYNSPLASDWSRLRCARAALYMVDFETQKLWMKFILSLCLVVFVVEYGAEASYIGMMITLMWTEFAEFARAYREVRREQQS